MAVISYEDVNPPFIANTIMRKRFIDGEHKQYTIVPADGYVLHDNEYDSYEDYDDDGNPIGEPSELGYTYGECSCAANYDFTANPRQFYAVPENTVSDNQIFGGGGNDHEVMSETEETETE